MSEEDQPYVLSILGARVTGPDPVTDVWIPVRSGVSAFYGLNGAGKTRLLHALASVYEGSGEGYLVARAVPAPEPGSRDFWTRIHHDRQTFEGTNPAWAALTEGRAWNAEGRPRHQQLLGQMLWAVMEPYGLDWADSEAELVLLQVSEIVRQNLFALTPRLGHTTEWDVCPAAIIESSTPALNNDRERLLAISDRYINDAITPHIKDPDALLINHYEESVFREIVSGTARHHDSALTSLTPFFDILRDLQTDWIGRESRLLDDSAMVPYRIGQSDLFDSIGQISGSVATIIRDDKLSSLEANHETRLLLSDLLSKKARGIDGVVGPSDELSGEETSISEYASTFFRMVLPDAPELTIDLKGPQDWFEGRAAEWLATDLVGRVMPIEQLSEAQLRWALVAISLSLQLRGELEQERFDWRPEMWSGDDPVAEDCPIIISLDEPDGALHATAQRHAIHGLVTLATEFEASIFCTTHSRDFLNAEDVRLHHVSRDVHGNVQIYELEEPRRSQLEDLGLEPADLFLLHKVILLVEGTHDEIVIEGFIGDELQRAHTIVLPMRGGRNLATVFDAQVFTRFSDAPVVAALDNLRAEEVGAFWQELVDNRAEGQSAFDEIVKRHFSNKAKAENAFLIDYCRAAAEADQLDRFRIFGFEEPDIPQYLPVSTLVPAVQSWLELRNEFATQSKFSSFKPWLRAAYDVEVTEDLLRRGLAAMDEVPSDFTSLADLCREVATKRASGR